ncbi:MAG: WD40/YVTN/BNR-like repeat-containing protein, partial [Haloechinothrix sp.]
VGFTVAGPKRFLASGHPAGGDDELRVEGQPLLLGVIESTDAGENWRPLSLLGQTNFAALAAAHDRVYGFSAADGRFMVRRVRRWVTRSQIALHSFAVDPGDPDHIVGAAARGVVESVDGGRTWNPIDSPELVLLTWQGGGGLWGADEGGKIHRSFDGGSSWERAGELPGEPEALLAGADALYAAVRDKGIFRSSDKGRTWKLRPGQH